MLLGFGGWIHSGRVEHSAVGWPPSVSYYVHGRDGGNLGQGYPARAVDVSGDGSMVVGTVETSLGWRAFRWTASGGMVYLSDPAGFGTDAVAVSDDTSTVVGHAFGYSGAFRWTASTGVVRLGDFPGAGDTFDSWPSAVSADGSLVVGEVATWLPDPGGGQWWPGGAFPWDADHGMREMQHVLTDDYGLDLTGWRLLGATGISADGLTITGNGENPNGDFEAWVVALCNHLWIPGTGDFNDPSKWRPFTAPGPADVVEFNPVRLHTFQNNQPTW